MKTVGEIVRGRTLLHVQAKTTVFEAAEFMSENRIGAVPVLDGGHLVGVFSERDLMTRVVVPGRDPHETSIREVMTQDLVIAQASDTHEHAVAQMAQRGCRHLPVVESENLLGFLSLRDLLQVEIEEQAESLAMMEHYVHYIPPEVEARIRDASS
jgi:CBS domain-containing protein